MDPISVRLNFSSVGEKSSLKPWCKEEVGIGHWGKSAIALRAYVQIPASPAWGDMSRTSRNIVDNR